MGREEDALIAEKLFGWQWACGRYVDAGAVPSHYFLVPPSDIEGITTIRRCDPPKDRASVYTEVPAYTSDPAAEMSVLETVKSEWSEKDRQAFVRALCKELRIRDTDYSTSGTMAIFVDHFKVGAYSRAALAVLKAKQPALPPGKEG